MKTIALSDLRSDIRVKSGIRDSQYFTDAQIDRLINKAAYSLTGRIVALPGVDLYEEPGSISVVSGTSAYAFPAGAYEIKFITYESNGSVKKLRQFNRADYPVDSSGLSADIGGLPAFRVVGNYIHLIPTPTTDYTLTVYYIPHLPGMYSATGTAKASLQSDTDYFDDKWNYSDWIIYEVACRIMEDQEEDTARYRKEQEIRWGEIMALLLERVQSTPKRLPEPKQYNGSISAQYPIWRR
jgi:hypothetical protein